MEKVFTRSSVRDYQEKLQERLNEIGKEFGLTLTLTGGNYSSDKFKLNLEGRMLGEDGSAIVSDTFHALVDSKAKYAGLDVHGHLIGSIWKVRDEVYTVTDYKSKRPKYPISLTTAAGRSVKASINFLKQGKQLTLPTEDEFYIWLTVDPEEDAVRESDVEIVDRVQDYFESAYDYCCDPFLEAASKLTEKGVSRKNSKRIYNSIVRENLKVATDLIEEIL